MKSKAYSLGFVTGIIIVAIVIVIIRVFLKRKTGVFSNEYDERQKAIQGVGYKIAYMTTLYLVALGGVASMWMEKFPLSMLEFAITVIWISICVFVTYCIMKDAYLSFRARRKTLLAVWLAVGAVNIAMCFMPMISGETDSISYTNLLTGIALVYLSAVMGVKALIERKGGEE